MNNSTDNIYKKYIINIYSDLMYDITLNYL